MAFYPQIDDDDKLDDYNDSSDDDFVACSSKNDVSSSSDEDGDEFLEKLRLSRLAKQGQTSNGGDDFEREMASELSITMQKLTASICKKSSAGAAVQVTDETVPSTSLEKPPEFYDDIYFDSDDSGGEEMPSSANKASGSKKRKNNRRILSNDELFYDPKMDDRDQAWMDKMRRSYEVKSKSRSGTRQTSQNPLPESDAVLNCPACLTMLCMDCQRHEIYHNQYRAMFVFNCNIIWTEVLKFPKKNQKECYFKGKKKLKKTSQEPQKSLHTQEKMNEEVLENVNKQGTSNSSGDVCLLDQGICTQNAATVEKKGKEFEAISSAEVAGKDQEDIFYPVTCKICNTKVAVYDKDEVYHFFNIVTSY